VGEKRDLLARLLGRLAHEIRNPLSSLDIHVQLLQEDVSRAAPQLRGQLSERLALIKGELNRLENIVKRFLRLASPTALELELVDIAQLIGHVRQLLEPEADSRQIELSVTVDPDLPHVIADGVQLTQALLNLLINAFQAVGPHGKIQVRAGQAGVKLFFEVTDDGPGIPPEKIASVFEPYFTTKEEGSGLGLWIAQQIAAAHGGNLTVRNHQPHGTVFRFEMPLKRDGAAHG
jgi:two-component system sensor histidine kinase HydH